VFERGGCHVAWYNRIRWYSLRRFNNRTHRKSLIIDSRIAFTAPASPTNGAAMRARRTSGATCRFASRGRPSCRCHQKTMAVGGRWVTIGTANFDSRSFAHNEKSNIGVFDAGLAQQLRATFAADTAGCARVDVESWRHRGVWARAQEFVAAFLQEQA